MDPNISVDEADLIGFVLSNMFASIHIEHLLLIGWFCTSYDVFNNSSFLLLAITTSNPPLFISSSASLLTLLWHHYCHLRRFRMTRTNIMRDHIVISISFLLESSSLENLIQLSLTKS